MAGEQLRVTEGNARGQRLTVEAELLLGRAMSVEGRLGDDPVLSRRHARLARDAEGRLTIEDLGSAYGTFVNGRRLDAPRTLDVGDVVSVGRTILQVTDPSGGVPEHTPRQSAGAQQPAGSGEQLLVIEGTVKGHRLTADGLVIGRSVEGEGRVPDDPELSRRHARVARDADGRLTIEDLGSANGTFVNGVRVRTRQALNVGDLVRVGSTTLQLIEFERAATGPAPETEVGRAPEAPPSSVEVGPTPEVAPTPRPARAPRLGALADLAARGRVGILGIAVLLTVAGIVLGAPLPGRLKTGDDFADPSSQSIVGEGVLARAAGIEPGPGVVAVVRADGGRIGSPTLDARAGGGASRDVELARGARSESAQRKVERVARVIGADPAVGRVVTYYQGPAAPFVSKDRRATYVLGFLRPGSDARATSKRLRPQLSFLTGVSLGGGALIREAVARDIGKSLATALAIAIPMLYLLSLAVLRGFVAALLPVLVGVVTVFVTLLSLRLANAVSALSSFTLNLVVGLGLGSAVVYSLLIVTRYREDAGSGPRTEALRRTLRTAGRTVLFSAVTVAVALLTLVVFPQRVLDSTGIGGAISSLTAGAAALIALPALLAALGERGDALAPPAWQRAMEGSAAARERSGRWYRLSQRVVRHPVLVLVASGAVLLAVGLPLLGLKSTGVDARVLSESSSPRQVADALQREFVVDPTATVRLSVAAPPTAMARLGAYAAELERLPEVASVGSPTRLNQSTWQIDVQPAHPALDQRSRDLVGRIRGAPAPFPVAVTGESAALVDEQHVLANRLPLALALLVLSTSVILLVMTRSLILPIVAVLTNLLVLSATFGLVVLVFQHHRLEALLDYTGRDALYSTEPNLLLAVAFALSTAFSLFVVAHIREARDAGARSDVAVSLGLARGGPTVTAAALLFSVALGAFAVSAIDFVELLVVGSVLAVLIHAMFARALLVPAFLGLVGERDW
jgi:pSer/pThr/pTyr-binding forkhead associated (FHA) protein/predicted RND superfamily exporter protein